MLKPQQVVEVWVGVMTVEQVSELYDATVDDVWRTARG